MLCTSPPLHAGSPPIAVQWYYEGREITNQNPDYVLTHDGTCHALLILDVLPEDAGLYACAITDRYGDDDVTYCHVTVTGPYGVVKHGRAVAALTHSYLKKSKWVRNSAEWDRNSS